MIEMLNKNRLNVFFMFLLMRYGFNMVRLAFQHSKPSIYYYVYLMLRYSYLVLSAKCTIFYVGNRNYSIASIVILKLSSSCLAFIICTSNPKCFLVHFMILSLSFGCVRQPIIICFMVSFFNFTIRLLI